MLNHLRLNILGLVVPIVLWISYRPFFETIVAEKRCLITDLHVILHYAHVWETRLFNHKQISSELEVISELKPKNCWSVLPTRVCLLFCRSEWGW